MKVLEWELALNGVEIMQLKDLIDWMLPKKQKINISFGKCMVCKKEIFSYSERDFWLFYAKKGKLKHASCL